MPRKASSPCLFRRRGCYISGHPLEEVSEMRRSGWLTFSAVVLITAGIMREIDAIWAFGYHGTIPRPAGCAAGAQPQDLRLDMADHRRHPDRRRRIGPWTERPAQRRGLPLGGHHRRGPGRDLGDLRDSVLPVWSLIYIA